MDVTNNSYGVGQHAADIVILNQKMLAEDTISDISINRKSLLRHQDAWETQRIRQAQFHSSFDNALLAAVAIANQTGGTADQQTVSPIRTGAGDNLAAGAVPSNRVVDNAGAAVAAGIAQSVQTNVTAQTGILATQIASLTTMVNDLAGSVTTNLQAASDSNASIAASLAAMAAALTALAPKA